jgi:hypothetical protein
VRLLEIEVPAELLRRWRRYLAPEWQPFFVRPEDGLSSPEMDALPVLTDDLRCTYTAWRVRDATAVVWFDEKSYMELSRADRARLVRSQVERRRGAVPSVRRWQGDFEVDKLRAQADGHRFVWWPSLLDENPEPVMRAQVEDGQLPTRHREVSEETWRRCKDVVPRARDIVGAFPESSGANCFGTTLAATGRAVVADRALQDQFESFLEEHCTPGGRDEDPGTVLVWRDRDAIPSHSAVTIGDGWGVEKPAETWWTPTIVADVAQLIRVNRSVGLQLERHRPKAR